MSIIRSHPFFRVLRFARRLVLAIGIPIALLAGILTFAVPLVMESDWGRTQLERGLSRAFGTEASIGRVDWSWRKGITLEEVSLSPASCGSREVRLRIGKARFKPKYRKLFSRRIQGELVLYEPVVELRGEILTDPPTSLRWPRPRGRGIRIEKIRIHGATLVIHESGTASPVVVEDLQAVGRLECRRDKTRISIRGLRAVLNGGTISGQAWLATDHGRTAADLRLQGADIALDPGVSSALRSALSDLDESVGGLLDFEIHASGKGSSIDEAMRRGAGEGWFALREGLRDADVSFQFQEGRLLTQDFVLLQDGGRIRTPE